MPDRDLATLSRRRSNHSPRHASLLAHAARRASLGPNSIGCLVGKLRSRSNVSPKFAPPLSVRGDELMIGGRGNAGRIKSRSGRPASARQSGAALRPGPSSRGSLVSPPLPLEPHTGPSASPSPAAARPLAAPRATVPMHQTTPARTPQEAHPIPGRLRGLWRPPQVQPRSESGGPSVWQGCQNRRRKRFSTGFPSRSKRSLRESSRLCIPCRVDQK